MGVSVSYWDRRDSADRAAMGMAAVDLCQAQRLQPGVADSRFYWTGPDQIVVQATTTDEVDWNHPDPKVAESLFALADVARQTSFQQWLDPKLGMENYRKAGRLE